MSSKPKRLKSLHTLGERNPFGYRWVNSENNASLYEIREAFTLIALYLLGVSQVTKFMNFDIKIFFDKLIPYCKSKCCAKIQLSIFIASHRNNYLENIFLYRVL